ncbi:DUF4391 domain-containing protein [Neiella sp. HB171785]|uniref:DUF4391 domain-containing protein n=1 Tax=Neiella litorisoli TaxID=2771431 RepID=A0A8J6QFL4_9GAMM|nr:DUF4391 domain-containing protein [Neiella litorisoli]MBD1388854.1 DUF4391 domain-containing protein [Neiella litorisoli]
MEQTSMANAGLAEQFLESFALPKSTLLGVKVPKKTLTDNVSLVATDKGIVRDVLKSVEWSHTLKPETANIPVFVDGTHEYQEIAVLTVTVKSRSKTKQLCRLLHLHIPYPLLLIVKDEKGFALSLADKRVNQSDSSKLTIEHQYDIGWLEAPVSSIQQAFLEDITFSGLSKISLYDFYLDLIGKFNRLEAATFTGQYSNKANDAQATAEQTNLIVELKALEADLSSLRNKIKKEVQMNNKVKLNLNAREIKNKIKKITEQLD